MCDKGELVNEDDSDRDEMLKLEEASDSDREYIHPTEGSAFFVRYSPRTQIKVDEIKWQRENIFLY